MSAASPPVLRFAPSPNGYLHLGHAYSALTNARMADRLGGRLLLRMEDIDVARCRPEFDAAIIADLEWLGVRFDSEVRRQSQHFPDYGEPLRKLTARGLLYPCFCTRSEIVRAVVGRRNWPRDPDGSPHYPGLCKQLDEIERTRRLAAGRPAALRIDMANALAILAAPLAWQEFGESEEAREILAEPARWGDAVIARRDIPASYHIAVVVDDYLQGITDVVRGEDLFEATSLHRLLQELLQYAPPRYRHHQLIRGQGGDKLSKSTSAKSIRALRKEGVSAQELMSRLGFDDLRSPSSAHAS